MRNLVYFSNCQGEGLHKFMLLNSRYVAEFKVTMVMSFLTDLKLCDETVLWKALPEADVFIYHYLDPTPGAHRLSVAQMLSTVPNRCQVIPLSVVFNSGPFIFHHGWSESVKADVKKNIAKLGLTGATKFYMQEGDLGWVERSESCMARMKEKEVSDGVPEPLRISEFMGRSQRNRRMLLTYNHPASALFWPWAVELAAYLGVPFENPDAERVFDPNYAGLPCRHCVCESARKHLGLQFIADTEGETHNEMYTALSTLL
jgi:hypothetical protein